MKVIGLDNREYSWGIHNSNPRGNASSYHQRARTVLTEMFPFDKIAEELAIPSTRLYCDFYVPSAKLMVEVHGQQHYEYVHLFHKNKLNYYKGKARDRQKIEFCNANYITYVELPFGENDVEWTTRIRNALTS